MCPEIAHTKTYLKTIQALGEVLPISFSGSQIQIHRIFSDTPEPSPGNLAKFLEVSCECSIHTRPWWSLGARAAARAAEMVVW
jgi:hypothetical protein